MGKVRVPTGAELDRQLDAARARTKAARAAGMRAASARYDARGERVVLSMTSGVTVGIPVADIPYLAKATPAQLKVVSVTPAGDGVSWDDLDVDLTLEGLLETAFGRQSFARAMGRTGGRATSAAKAEAARANGAKGGRPRRKVA